MANSKSAEKRIRQTKTRTAENRVVKTRVKKCRKALNSALEGKDKAAAGTAYGELSSAADRAVKKGVIHRNSASRLKRIYAARIAAI
ncbi:MAG: 30S ribosomal protein S20 [Verrucomicrobiota bacterium]